MDKKTIQTVVAVVLGIAVFSIVATVISFIFEACLYDYIVDISEPGTNVENTIKYAQGASIGIICIGAAAIVCYCFTYFIKNKKVFGIISVVLSALLVAMSIAFIFDLSEFAKEASTSQGFSIASAFFGELVTMIVACLIVGAYFTVVTVRAFKPQNVNGEAAQSDVAMAENAREEGGETNEKV